jgi:tetratricopeptide (TPR) repeat protein
MELVVQKKYDDAEWLLLDEERKNGQRPSIDFLLAKIYTERNKASTQASSGDAVLGILRWERIVQGNPENKEYQDKLLTCRKISGFQYYNAAQILLSSNVNSDHKKIAKEMFNVETFEEAKNLALGGYARAIIQLKQVVKGLPDDVQAWSILGDCYAHIESNSLAINAYRQVARLKPNEPRVYLAIAAVYMKNNMTWAIIDEMNSGPESEREQKRRMYGKAVITALDEFSKKKVPVAFITQSPDQAKKLAQVFYLTSSLRWEDEMKKEKSEDRDFGQSLHNLFFAATFDYQTAKTDDEKDQVLKRLENGYDPINKGLENKLGTLEKTYEHQVKSGRLRVQGAPELLQSLKEYSKRKM